LVRLENRPGPGLFGPAAGFGSSSALPRQNPSVRGPRT
jgi:hypothetical protein